MSTFYEYDVVRKRGFDKNQVDTLLKTSNTSEIFFPYIPTRSVAEVRNNRFDRRTSSFILTPEEAEALRQDRTVLAVEVVPPICEAEIDLSIFDEAQLGFTGSSVPISGGFLLRTTSSTQPGNFIAGIPSPVSNPDDFANYLHTGSLINHGLRMISQRNENDCVQNNFLSQQSTNNTSYDFTLDGTGVDVIISDPGFRHKHTEFTKQTFPNPLESKVIVPEWDELLNINGSELSYNPAFGPVSNGYHGTYMGSVCFGNLMGVAKGVTPYFLRTELTNPRYFNSFHVARLFHESKSIDPATGFKRPTIFVQSIGQQLPLHVFQTGSNGVIDENTHINSHSFKNNVVTDPDADLPQFNVARGLIRSDGKIPIRTAATDAAAEQMEDAGVIFITSAGNVAHPAFESGSEDDPYFDPFDDGWYNSQHYDNFITIDRDTSFGPANTKIFYSRGSSPLTRKTIAVGALSTNGFYPISEQNNPDFNRVFGVAPYSIKGPRTEIYAPSTVYNASIQSSLPVHFTSSFTNFINTNPPPGYNFRNANLYQLGGSGTSFAGPMVAGVVALYLQANPSATSLDVKTFLRANASIMSGSSAPYACSANGTPQNLNPSPTAGYVPLMGAPTKSVLFNPFTNKFPIEIKGPLNFSGEIKFTS